MMVGKVVIDDVTLNSMLVHWERPQLSPESYKLLVKSDAIMGDWVLAYMGVCVCAVPFPIPIPIPISSLRPEVRV